MCRITLRLSAAARTEHRLLFRVVKKGVAPCPRSRRPTAGPSRPGSDAEAVPWVDCRDEKHHMMNRSPTPTVIYVMVSARELSRVDFRHGSCRRTCPAHRAPPPASPGTAMMAMGSG
jgi:hypothetical protein